MIGLLDPALFLPHNSREVEQELNLVASACREHKVCVVPLEEYWDALWTHLGRPLERALDPSARRALQEIRKLGSESTLRVPPLPLQAGKAWRAGFRQLFDWPGLGDPWQQRMVNATIRAVSAGGDVIIFVRRIPGRNLLFRASAGSTLEENTRWLLHVQPKGLGHKHVLCVCHPRNLVDRWTARFDWRLPGAVGGAPFPFCPPDNWWKGSTPATRTIVSKPAWIDRHGNGWARPNIAGGAGYHWDVFIQSPALQEAVGLGQINVVQFGAPPAEGTPGQLHHIPTSKAHVTVRAGWTC